MYEHVCLLFSALISRLADLKKEAYGLKPEVWGRVVPDPRAELQVDPAQEVQTQGLEILHFVLHHLYRRTVIRLTHHIMANRDVIINLPNRWSKINT